MLLFSTLIPQPFRNRLIAAASPCAPYGRHDRVRGIEREVDELRKAHPELFLSPEEKAALSARYAELRADRRAQDEDKQVAA